MRLTLATGMLLLGGCSSLAIVQEPSVNHNSRINFLVLHFTSESFSESTRLLTTRTENPVSAHYLVPEPGDPTYGRGRIRVHQLVAEQRRAWHAGKSYWAGADALNDTSIGIEIVNRSACVDRGPETATPTPEEQDCVFLPYPEEQLQLVIRLVTDILARNPEIDPVDVVGHGDIAPGRRVDPGPLFPWKHLYDEGIGAWYDERSAVRYRRDFDRGLPGLGVLQQALNAYGYGIEVTGEADTQTRFVVRAFQMHFRPSDPSGVFDAETVAILYALIEKYRPDRLIALLQAQEHPTGSPTDEK